MTKKKDYTKYTYDLKITYDDGLLVFDFFKEIPTGKETTKEVINSLWITYDEDDIPVCLEIGLAEDALPEQAKKALSMLPKHSEVYLQE